MAREGGVSGAPSDQPSVLVIDSDPTMRAFFNRALERAGFITYTAENDEEALNMVQRRAVSVVLLDVHIQGAAGIDLVRRFRIQPETTTLPILLVTGSGTSDLVVQGLEAGANDYLSKPVAVVELIARIRGLVRGQKAWTDRLRDELNARSAVLGALGQLELDGSPEDVALAAVDTLVATTNLEFIALHQVVGVGELRPLALYQEGQGVRTGMPPLEARMARTLLDRAANGPWTDVAGRDMSGPNEGLARISVAAIAGAPIYAHGRIVALLVMGYVAGSTMGRSVSVSPERRSRLLASVIDYSSILSTLAGEQIAGNTEALASRAVLEEILDRHAFATVFQPIVSLTSRKVFAYEALTRFDDGIRPDVRFREADGAGLGADYEAATMERALAASAALPPKMMLSLNASPDFVLDGSRLGELLATTTRPVVLEITEHSRIDDYDALRSALTALGGDIRLAVDDAGAGFSSLRHILELKPSYAKLDLSIVQGIERDTVRQALVTGLDYFARRTDCSLIAEGVETQADAETLERLGVELAQGYLFGRPAALT